MAPGAKKKSVNRRTSDTQSDNKKDLKKEEISPPVNCREIDDVKHVSGQEKKYTKRTVANNWQRYEETPSDPHADTMRGKDIEVLLSYSGGTGSQLQLQDEKDWEDAGVDEKSIVLDIKDLIHVVKSIPFHKQINVSENVFTKEQIFNFESSAENWKNTYKSELEKPMDSKEKFESPESLDNNLNIIDNCESEEEQESPKPILLEEKTENIIESIASCLSLKSSNPERSNSDKQNKSENDNIPDELDFLLSLNVSLKNPLQNDKKSENKETNVDDWLNSILDD